MNSCLEIYLIVLKLCVCSSKDVHDEKGDGQLQIKMCIFWGSKPGQKLTILCTHIKPGKDFYILEGYRPMPVCQRGQISEGPL